MNLPSAFARVFWNGVNYSGSVQSRGWSSLLCCPVWRCTCLGLQSIIVLNRQSLWHYINCFHFQGTMNTGTTLMLSSLEYSISSFFSTSTVRLNQVLLELTGPLLTCFTTGSTCLIVRLLSEALWAVTSQIFLVSATENSARRPVSYLTRISLVQ